ncbi:MAG: hypothetical protein D6753_10640 [Planctomycetota bacterium]|nr:MAG: hypothetical protein D6753_10640 [Planctomycetota bacterium]
MELHHESDLTTAVFSSGRQWIASGGNEGQVRLWDAASGELEGEFSTAGRSVLQIEFRKDDAVLCLLVAESQGPDRSRRRLLLVDTQSLELRWESPLVLLTTSFAFADDGEYIVASSEDGQLHCFSTESGQLQRSTRPHIGQALGQVTWLRNISKYAVTSGGQTTMLLDSDLRETCRIPTHSGDFGLLSRSGDGTILAVGGGDGSVRILQTADLNTPRTVFEDTVIRSLCFHGQQILAARDDGLIDQWEARSGELSQQIMIDPMQRAVLSVAASPDGNRIAACGMMRHLAVYPVQDPSNMTTAELPPGGHSAVAWSPDGATIAVGGRQPGLLLFDAHDLSRAPVRPQVAAAVSHLGFSSDSRWIAVALADGTVQVLGRDGHLAATISDGLSGRPTASTFLYDDQQLLVTTRHGHLCIYDVESGRLVHRWRGHGGAINGLALLPHERAVVTAGRDRTLRLWDLESRQLISQLTDHDRAVVAVSVSRDGSILASAGVQGDVRIWRAH